MIYGILSLIGIWLLIDWVTGNKQHDWTLLTLVIFGILLTNQMMSN